MSLPRVVRMGVMASSGLVSARQVTRSMFRSMTADMRLLVMLDNTGGAAQVRPLLPAGAARSS